MLLQGKERNSKTFWIFFWILKWKANYLPRSNITWHYLLDVEDRSHFASNCQSKSMALVITIAVITEMMLSGGEKNPPKTLIQKASYIDSPFFFSSFLSLLHLCMSCHSACQLFSLLHSLIKYNNLNVTLSHWNTVMQMEFGYFLFFYCKTPYAQNNHVFIRFKNKADLKWTLRL